MIDLLCPHGANNADIVGNTADMREQLAHFLPGLAELLKFVLRAEADEWAPLQLRDLLTFRQRFGHRLAVHFAQLRFVVEGLEM